MATPEQIAAVRAISSAILEAVTAAGPTGAPGGIIYAALMHYGITLSQYQMLMAALTRTGRVSKRGECYHATKVA